MSLQIVPQEIKKEKIYEGEDAILRLKELGLLFGDIEFVTKEAIKEDNNLSKHAYSMEKNNKFFCSLIRHFREKMSISGWSKDDSYNLNKTLPPDKKNIFIFSSGDKNVCNADDIPMTKNKKGEVSLAVVEMNNSVQLNLLEELFPELQIVPEKYDIGKSPHWFFLFNKVKNKVKIELSLPEGIDSKTHKICQWVERIILPEIKLNEDILDEISMHNIRNNSCYNKEDELNITRKK